MSCREMSCDFPLRYGKLGRTWVCPHCETLWFVTRGDFGRGKAWKRMRFHTTFTADIALHEKVLSLSQQTEELRRRVEKGKKR